MASNQRTTALKEHLSKTSADQLRPILTSLNGDNSWLLSFPIPVSSRTTPGKYYYHAVLDAWLTGPSSQLSEWLIYLELAEPPKIGDGAGAEAVAREIDAVVVRDKGLAEKERRHEDAPAIDALFTALHYPDHLHQPTMLTFDPRIPVFATAEAAAIIRPWQHFTTVITTRDLLPPSPGSATPTEGWATHLHPGPPLPFWLSIFRLPGHHELNFATAIVWNPTNSQHEAILYSPHGIRTDQPSLRALLRLDSPEPRPEPRISVLAILHALKLGYAFGTQVTLSVTGGLQLARAARPHYWVKTHDSMLKYSGVVMRLGRVKDYARTMEWGLAEEKKLNEQGQGDLKPPTFVEVENGDCFVLQ